MHRHKSNSGNVTLPIEYSIKGLQEMSNDLLSTLNINKQMLKELIDGYCSSLSEDENGVKELAEQFYGIEEAGGKFFAKNASLRSQVLAAKNDIEKKKAEKKMEVDSLRLRNKELETQLYSKEGKVKSLKNSLELYQEKLRGSFASKKGFLKPTKESLAKHNELQTTKSTLKKLNTGIIKESAKERELLTKNKKIKDTNEKLKQILRNIIEKGADDFPEKTEAILQSIQDEEMKLLLNNSMDVPPRLDQTELRDSGSPAKESSSLLALNASVAVIKPHKLSNAKKPFIPPLDFSKIKGRVDLLKAKSPAAPPIKKT
eukprot:TRINITY_DN4502_c0_g5_i1.p1 TRINITY_DN4502_c0_g5~~TRINITY_DN4502_c0_g5_i1.p1  ORF type:complete len:316 (+),score=90.91 TRINITY_DN4502_c0_g5_i1:156-1103(+)